VEVEQYDHSPTAAKTRAPSFRTSRPSLSRQLSDAALKAKRHAHADDELPGRGDNRTDTRFTAKPAAVTSPPMQAQVLQVNLPPKSSTSSNGEMPRTRSGSDVLQQPEQVRLPSAWEPAMRQLPASKPGGRTTEMTADNVGRDVARSARTSQQFNGQPPSVDVCVVDSSAPLRQQGRTAGSTPSTTSSQQDAPGSQTGRPWQYESQSSQSSRDTQSSQDSQSSPRGPELSRSPRTNGVDSGFYDWRQPEAKADRSLEKRSSTGGSPTKPATAVMSRVMSKPPLPPKILTRPSDARTSSEGSASSSPLHKQDEGLVPAAVSPSLTSPPSPAPKDSQRRLTGEHGRGRPPHVERHPSDPWPAEQRPRPEERFIALNDTSLDTSLPLDEEFEVRRRKAREPRITGLFPLLSQTGFFFFFNRLDV
jgi:hypothetical protein